MTAKSIEKKLKANGWVCVRSSGSHRQYQHPVYEGTVTVPYHPSKDIHIGTVKNIERQSGLSLKR